MRSGRFVCLGTYLSFCLCSITAKSKQPISLKLGAMIGSTSRKNRLTFGGDPVPGAYFGSLFIFPHSIAGEGISGDLVAYSQGQFSRRSAKWNEMRNDWRRQRNESTTFWERSDRHPVPN